MNKLHRIFPLGIISIVCLLLFSGNVKAQTDTAYSIICGADANSFLRGGHDCSGPPSYSLVSASSFPSHAIQHCGVIDVYYEDVYRNFQRGFDDTTLVGTDTLGVIRRNTLCGVLTYIQSVFDFSNVDSTHPIRLYIDTSFDFFSHPASVDSIRFYAQAYPQYDSTTPGVKNGWFRDYVCGATPAWLHTDSISPDQYHGYVQVNFDRTYDPTYGFLHVGWTNEPSLGACIELDLYSALLHEIGHVMGWFSLVNFTGTGIHNLVPVPSIVGSNVFTGIDWSLRVGNNTYPLSLNKLLSGTISSPTLNPTDATTIFRNNNNYWLNDSAAPKNQPVYSGGSHFGGAPNSYLSHLDDRQLSYTFRQRISPGDQQNYVMGPFALAGARRREFSKGEIQGFVDIMGYKMNHVFDSLYPEVYHNHTPFSERMAGYSIAGGEYGYFTETVTPDYTITNNAPSTSVTVSVTSAMLADIDPGDSANITIDSITIANLRGCGSGDNNHNLLTLSPDHKSLIYTPRSNFYGLAQMGFNITDGKERGSYVVITVNVLKGTNVSCVPGENMVCNPGFEEGTEVKRNSFPDYFKHNAAVTSYGVHEGRWHGIHFSDSHPYNFLANRNWFSVAKLPGAGVIIKNSEYSCDVATGWTGSTLLSCPTLGGLTGLDNPEPSSGQRYQALTNNGKSYYYLRDSLETCHRYILEFDGYWPDAGGSVSSVPLKFGFTDTIVNFSTSLPILRDSLYNTLTFGDHTWTHFTIPFNYCGSVPSHIFYMEGLITNVMTFDNMSLKEDTTPIPPLLVDITQSPPVPCSRTLTAHVTNALCDVGYTWTTTIGSILSTADSTAIVTNTITATYTVTVTDGCRSEWDSITVIESIPGPIEGHSLFCIGSSATFTDSLPGGTWTSSAPSVATVGSSTGVVTGVSSGTATITYHYCPHIVTMTVTVIAAVPAITGTTLFCRGGTTTLSNAASGGAWSSSNISIATVGSTGIVSGVGGGMATITYAISPACYSTITVTVDTLFALRPISGTMSTCVGSSSALAYHFWAAGHGGPDYSGGTWSSSNPAVGSISPTGTGCDVVGVSFGVTTITYSVTTHCGTTYTTGSFTVNPLPAIITGTTNVCVAATTTLSNADAGGTWTSGSPSIATIGSTSGIVTGVSAGASVITYTLPTGCIRTTVVSVHPVPAAITGVPITCVGATTALGCTTPGGIWSSSNTGIATVGSGTGAVTGAGTGIATITYTASGCFSTLSVSVITAPASITGTLSACPGGSRALSSATPYGTWSSASTGVATVGSGTGTVTAIVAGTSVITYSLGTGCSTTAIFTVNPVPSAITGILLVCTATPRTLSSTSSGGLWSSADPLFATIGSASGIVTGILVGTVAITYTLPTGCYTTAIVTVASSPAVITGPSTVCVGSTVTLSNATIGGTWSSSSTSLATVGSTGIVTGVSAGTVTISYTVSGCSRTKTVTVAPLPGPITGFGFICAYVGSSPVSVLTGTPAGGTWSSSDVAIGTVGSASGVVVPVSIGVVNITYTTALGCFTTFPVTIYDSIDECSPCYHFDGSYVNLYDAILSSGSSGSRLVIDNDVTIAGNVTWTHNTVFVRPGKHIYVNDTSSFTIQGSHLFSCSGMWEGITLQTGSTSGTTTTGRLVLESDADGRHSLIEDATTAVRIENPVIPSAGGSYFLTSESTTFNRNITGISIKRYSDTAATYPFRIRNTVFTSRDVSAHYPGYPFRWPKTWSSTASDTAFKHAYTPMDDFMPPFKIDDPNAMGTGNNFPGIACKNSALPTIGIRLDSVGTFTPSGSYQFAIPIPSGYSEIKIGDETTTTRNQYQNLFDNLRYGIYATNSNFTCVNNAFTNIFSYIGDILPGGDPGGYGVFALASASLNRLRVYSGPGSAYTNKFYGFRIAVGCNNYFNFTGKNTYMINKNTGVSSGSMVNFDGEAGYKLKTAKYTNIDVSYDTITNVYTGVLFWIAVDPGGYTADGALYPSQLLGPCSIDHNLIQAHPSWAASLITQRIDQGIVVQNTISGGPVGPISLSRTVGNLNVSGNLIHDAYNGIYINNYWPPRGYATYSSVNNIHLRSNPVSNMKRMRLQYGINHTHCRAGRIYNNDVYGITSFAIANDSMRAYYASSWNSGLDIGCNTESDIGRGYEFFLTNPGTQWHDNGMLGNLKGYVLNGGWIGPQRYTGHPVMNNEWFGPWDSVTHPQTFVYNGATASSSNFYVNNTAIKNPVFNSYDDPSPLVRYSMTTPVSIYTTTATSPDCYPISSPPNDTLDLFSLIAQQHVDYIYNTVSSYWMGQYALWKSILMDSMITDSSAIATQFAHMADSMSRYKYLTEMESLLAAGDFDSVAVMLGYDIDAMANTAFDAPNQVDMADGLSANFIVENYRQFYSLYMKYATATLNGSDSLDLFALAGLCPQIHGGVVHQARALYSLVYNDLSMFDDDSCLDADTGYIAGRHSNNGRNGRMNDGQQNYKIYPNPNDGNFALQQYIEDTGLMKIAIYDAVGRNAYKNSHSFINNKCDLELKNYPPGLYLLEITNSKKQIFRCKFVISK